MALRILVVAGDTYPATRVDVATLFVKHLGGRGHQIDWILQSETATGRSEVVPWGTGQVWVGRTNTGTSLVSRTAKHVLSILHDLRLFPLMASGRYDIIQVRDKFLSGIFAAIASRIFRKRFVFWLSFPIPEMYMLLADEAHGLYKILYRVRGAAFKFLLYRVLMPAADHAFVQTERMRDDISREGIAKEKMTAVPMGVDAEADWAAVAKNRVIPEHGRTFVYLGTIARTRHLDFLVRVLAKVRESVPDVKLYVVGGGVAPGDEELLTTEASRLGVSDALVLVGQRPRAEALAYVRDADVCVSPIYPSPLFNCGSPTKLVEYMAMGKAIVASNLDQIGDVLCHGETAWMVPPGDADALAKGLATLVHDRDLRANLGRAARRDALAHHTWRAHVKKILEALEARTSGRVA